MSSPLESPFNQSGAASATLSSSDSTAEAAFARENFDMDLDLGQGSDYDRLLQSVLSSQAQSNDAKATAPGSAVDTGDDGKEITRLTWEIMHIESQIKWTNVELADIKRQQTKIEKTIAMESRPERAKFITYIQAARDYVTYAISNPVEFKRTCQLLLSPEVTKQLEWMHTIRKYLQAMVKFVLQSDHMIRMQIGQPTGNCLVSETSFQAQVQSTAHNHAKYGEAPQLTAADCHTRLQRLIQQREEGKRLVDIQRSVLQQTKRENLLIQKSMLERAGEFKAVMKDVRRIDDILGAGGAFKQLDSLLMILWTMPCLVQIEADSTSLDSDVLIRADLFFRSLEANLPVILKAIVAHQKQQHDDTWTTAQRILRHPKFEREPYMSFKEELMDAWMRTVWLVMEKYQTDDGWMAVAGYETSRWPSGASSRGESQ